MTRLLLLRHGQTTWNAERRWQGLADAPLSELGREQARTTAGVLAAYGFGAIVASDLARALETAEIIAGELGLGPVRTDPALRERDVGAWSGLTTDEIEARWPGQIDAWRAGQLDQLPDGEGDISGRVIPAIVSTLVSHAGGTVLVVTHGGVIRTTERFLGVEPQSVRNMGGRWVALDEEGELIAGNAFAADPDAPTPTTTVL